MSTTTLPLRFHAFKLTPENRWGGIPPIVEAVRHAEDVGYDAVNLTDHIILPRGSGSRAPDDLYYDKTVVGSYLAAHTKRIRFLFFVMVIPYRPPIQTAKALATLDQVSNGRVTLGAGVGNLEREFEMLGVPFHERGAITDEYLRAMKGLWTEESPSFHGKYVSFEDSTFLPKCVQKPHIPLWIGGNGPAAIRRAVTLGQGFVPRSGSIEHVTAEIDSLKEKLAQAGRDPATFDFCYSLGIGERDSWRPPAMTAEAAAKGKSAEEGGFRMYPFDPGAVIEGIELLRNAGINNIFTRFSYKTPAGLMRQMDWFAAKVMPAFKSSRPADAS